LTDRSRIADIERIAGDTGETVPHHEVKQLRESRCEGKALTEAPGSGN
jgi:hypothetical protein